MIEMKLIYKAIITIGEVQELGDIHPGQRRIIPITGGSFEGPEMSGTILPGGADWQIVRRDGTAFLEARYTMQTTTGSLIYVENKGYRHGPAEVMARVAKGEEVDPALYYMRTVPFFETADPDLNWLNHTICVCTGAREANCVKLDVFAVA
jgi:hypothetical protein